jgi:hypothetical protein
VAYREFRQLWEEAAVLREKICQLRPTERQSPEEASKKILASVTLPSVRDAYCGRGSLAAPVPTVGPACARCFLEIRDQFSEVCQSIQVTSNADTAHGEEYASLNCCFRNRRSRVAAAKLFSKRAAFVEPPGSYSIWSDMGP